MFFNKANNRAHILTLLLLSSAGPVCESDFLPEAPGPSPQLTGKQKTMESPSTATSFISQIRPQRARFQQTGNT